MIIPADRKRAAVAFFAAIVLVLQSLVSVWAQGAPTPLDAFGNPLCINNEVPDGSRHSGDHLNFGECCAIVCNGWANSGLPPQDASLQTGIFLRISEPLGNTCLSSVSLGPDEKQGKPRAPPILI